MSKKHLVSLQRCCCVFAMKRVGLGKTEGRPEQLKLDEKPRLESPAAEMRRLRERLADIEDLMERCDARNPGKPRCNTAIDVTITATHVVGESKPGCSCETRCKWQKIGDVMGARDRVEQCQLLNVLCRSEGQTIVKDAIGQIIGRGTVDDAAES